MEPIFFSTESQSPAAVMIMDCFLVIKQTMQVESLSKYTDSLDSIAIIPFCVSEEFMRRHQVKERKYVSWKNRYADLRLQIDFETFVRDSKEERVKCCKEVILCSINIIKKKCEARNLRFDSNSLIKDIFPDVQT